MSSFVQILFADGVTTNVCGVEQSLPTHVRTLQLLLVLYPSHALTAQKTSVAEVKV